MVNRFLTSPEAVAQAVRAARTERGWSQAELATRSHVGRRFIVDLESGHPRAELAKVLDVLKTLDIHAMALPAPANTKRPEDIDLAAVISKYA